MKYYPHIKRILDFVFSLLFIVILFPLLLIVALILIFTSGAPVIFTQKRIGKGGKPFMIYKFRTMKSHAPELPSRDLPDDEYVSRFGRFLRRTGIDELPQLINIIKGDMSIVGPRPLIVDEKEMHALRMSLGVYKAAPGLTGLSRNSGGFKWRQSYFCCRKRKCPPNQFRSLCNAGASITDGWRSRKSRTCFRGCSHGPGKKSTRRK